MPIIIWGRKYQRNVRWVVLQNPWRWGQGIKIWLGNRRGASFRVKYQREAENKMVGFNDQDKEETDRVGKLQ